MDDLTHFIRGCRFEIQNSTEVSDPQQRTLDSIQKYLEDSTMFRAIDCLNLINHFIKFLRRTPRPMWVVENVKEIFELSRDTYMELNGYTRYSDVPWIT